jgi:hypothetical protein
VSSPESRSGSATDLVAECEAAGRLAYLAERVDLVLRCTIPLADATHLDELRRVRAKGLGHVRYFCEQLELEPDSWRRAERLRSAAAHLERLVYREHALRLERPELFG